MSLDGTPESPKTLSVPRAGRQYFALSRGASYAAAARGELPVIRIGRKLRVPIIALETMLEHAGKQPPRVLTRLLTPRQRARHALRETRDERRRHRCCTRRRTA